MRLFSTLLLALGSVLCTSGCVMVLGARDFSDDAKVVVIDDKIYVVDTESDSLRQLDVGAAIEVRTSESSDD